jgi:hypothetical protein
MPNAAAPIPPEITARLSRRAWPSSTRSGGETVSGEARVRAAGLVVGVDQLRREVPVTEPLLQSPHRHAGGAEECQLVPVRERRAQPGDAPVVVVEARNTLHEERPADEQSEQARHSPGERSAGDSRADRKAEKPGTRRTRGCGWCTTTCDPARSTDRRQARPDGEASSGSRQRARRARRLQGRSRGQMRALRVRAWRSRSRRGAPKRSPRRRKGHKKRPPPRRPRARDRLLGGPQRAPALTLASGFGVGRAVHKRFTHAKPREHPHPGD